MGCLRSVLASTPPHVPILIRADDSRADRWDELMRRLNRAGVIQHQLYYLPPDGIADGTADAGDACALSASSGMILPDSCWLVARGWLAALREAAYSRSNVASAMALAVMGPGAARASEQGSNGPLKRSLSAARRSLNGLSVTIDARILTGPTTGTQLHVLELIAALVRTGEPHLKVVVSAGSERVRPRNPGFGT